MKKLVLFILFVLLLVPLTAVGGNNPTNKGILDRDSVDDTRMGTSTVTLNYFKNLNRSCLIAYDKTKAIQTMECWPGRPDAAVGQGNIIRPQTD